MSRIRLADDEEILITEDNQGSGNDSSHVKDTERRIKARHILAFLGFLGFANVYAMRVNLSVAIVAMVNTTTDGNISKMASSQISFLLPFSSVILPSQPFFHHVLGADGNGSNPLDVCPVKMHTYIPENLQRIDDDNRGEFSWDESTQGLVLGSFFYGYVATQIPGGRLAELFGGRHVFGLGILLTGIFTLLSPPVARSSKDWGIVPFVLLRVMEGLAEGVTFPAMMAMMAKWVPPLERSRFSAFVYAGSLFGTVISMPISGLLCDIDLPIYWWLLGPGGWPLAFYIFGAVGVVWYFAWMALISDSPATNPSICPHERQYIEWSLLPHNEQDIHGPENHGVRIREDSAVNSSIPWWQLLTSLPLWAVLVTMCGQSWSFYTLLTELPTYLARALHFDIKQNSLLSSLPYLATWICSLPISWLADWLRASEYLSTTASLKIFNSIAVVLPSLGLIGVGYAGCQSGVILMLLVLNGAFFGATYAGVQVNHLALSPRLAGTLYGITNSFSNICGFLAPYATGKIIQGRETISQWRHVFLISAGLNLLANFFYILFASGDVQPWDDPEFDTDRRHSLPPISQPLSCESLPINDDPADSS